MVFAALRKRNIAALRTTGGRMIEFADIAEQCRQMGRADFINDDLEPPFGEKSLAYQFWQEGVEQAQRLPLLAIAEMETMA
jgi:hypothetical protein